MTQTSNRLTLKAAQQQVSALSVRITTVEGQYRVAYMFTPFADRFPNESRASILNMIESRAYYADSLEDAVSTARQFGFY